MSSESMIVFTKENLDTYLKELAKEFRKLNGKTTPAEIILIGGAAILANYGFREMTTDIDALINAASSMDDAIVRVGDKFGLPYGWLNADFKQTTSYTPKLSQYSEYYRTYSNVLTIRTVSAEYLIAMKLCSGRKYKNDLSDVIGVLAAHEERGESISLERIIKAATDLYGDWQKIPQESRDFIENAISHGDYANVYASVSAQEKLSKELLIDFEENYPGVATESNVNDVLAGLKARRQRMRQDEER